MTGIFKVKVSKISVLIHLVLAKDALSARVRTESSDPSEFEETSCAWDVTGVEEMTEEEIQMDTAHTIKLRPTQAQLYYKAVRKQGDLDRIFMEMTKGEDAITKEELRNLIANRPSLWNRYAAFLDTDVLKEGGKS